MRQLQLGMKKTELSPSLTGRTPGAHCRRSRHRIEKLDSTATIQSRVNGRWSAPKKSTTNEKIKAFKELGRAKRANSTNCARNRSAACQKKSSTRPSRAEELEAMPPCRPSQPSAAIHDWSRVPWKKRSKERAPSTTLKKFSTPTYGLEKIKERILEF